MASIYPALVSFVLAVLLTPLVRRLALKVGLVDEPDGHRKLHRRPTPLGGGVAVCLACAIAIGLALLFQLPGTEEIFRHPRFTLGFLGACTLICGVGLMDDLFELRGRQKLAAQILAVFIVVQGGLVIEVVSLFGREYELGLLAVPFTMFWLLGAINALNLIDGIDGLAGTVGVILSVTLAVLAGMMGHQVDAAFAWALGGAILGFLIYNLPPARIYLGDAGSMTIGLALGVLAIRGSLKGPATVALAAPTAIWAILGFDVLMAILRRKLTGQSLYATDRSHLHHVLQKRGLSVPMVLLVVGLLCIVCAIGALVGVAIKSEVMAIGTAAAVLATLVATNFFGGSEVRLFARRLRNLGLSMVRLPHRPPRVRSAVCSRFHGNREWEVLWKSLTDYADRFDLSSVQLNVSSPAIGEEYHAQWERKAPPPLSRSWRMEVPLVQSQLSVGRLTVLGVISDGAVLASMTELIEGLRPFELQLSELLEESVPVVADSAAALSDRIPVPSVVATLAPVLHAD